MGESDVFVLRAEIANVMKQLEKIDAGLDRQREETREDIKRIHERLDALRDAVPLKKCEEYREKCLARQETKNEKQDDKIIGILLTLAKWGGLGGGIGTAMKFFGN